MEVYFCGGSQAT
jgi:ribosome assembly protein RRB1